MAAIREQFAAVNWVRLAVIALILGLVVWGLWQHFCPQFRDVRTDVFHRVPVIRAVKDVQKIYIPCTQVATLDKEAVAAKLDLPWLTAAAQLASDAPTVVPSSPPAPAETAPVAGNPRNLQVTATADLPKSDSGYHLITVFDTASGETTPVVKEKPLPWVQLENHGSLGAWYGIDQDLDNTAQVDGVWCFLRIKRVHLGIKGDLSTDGGSHLLAGGRYEW